VRRRKRGTMFKRTLTCSFCRRSAAEVAKLVAGPRVYICDRCAAESVRIMTEAGPPAPAPAQASERPLVESVRRLKNWWRAGQRMTTADV
jgi:ATP-dependent Clp protease ATP-binding subunit ClpX